MHLKLQYRLKMQKLLTVSAIVVVILSSLIYLSELALSIVLLGILSAITVVFGITCVIWIHIKLSSTHSTGLMVRPILSELDRFREKLLANVQEPAKGEPLPIILGRTLDILLQQIIDLTLRDFVNYYLKNLVFQPKKLCDTFKEDIWSAFSCFHERLLRIDRSKLLACDMVIKITRHFEKIREITTNRPDNRVFRISPHLVSKEAELNYMKQVSELLIMFLLPRSYSLPPAKYFYRDIFTVKVLYTAIDTITDSDYINQSIKTYIESTHLNTIFMNKRQFESTNSYEEFIKIIQKSEDVAFIKSKRFYIVTKLMEATTILNIKRTKGFDVDAEKVTSGVSKAELNTIKKLKRWMDQLVAAKRECENRLSELGSDCGLQHEIIKPLSAILDHVTGRKYLSQFLEEMASSGLIGYWSAVEELKSVQRKNWHQVGAQIYYTYIKNPTIEIKVDNANKKRMEAFLLGDKGPEVFYDIQKQVVLLLEDKYYHQFINSKYYQNMVTAMDTPESEVDKNTANNLTDRQGSGDSTGGFDSNLYIGDHSNYSKRKLHELEEKLCNKLQALQAMRSSLKPDSRVLTYLEKEVTILQGEKRQLEAHLTRTEIWGENLGKWRAIVQSAEITEEKEPPTFVVIVEMDECAEETGDDISSGWVVSRTLVQFQELHRKLRPLCSNFKHVELPSQSLKLFGKPDKNALDKAKMQVQKYLEFVLNEDRLNQSEAIYAFLSPSADHLKETSASPKKSKFSLSTIFKSNMAETGSKDVLPFLKEHEDENLAYYLDTPGDIIDSKPTNGSSRYNTDESKDSIALPLYGLMGEIFNKSGVLQFVRKTLITFVQATYNRSINRQIHDTIAYCFSESMLHYYFTLLLKSFWPGGELYKPVAERTPAEKQETELEARALFLATVPDFFRQLVGNNAAKEGAHKIFDTLQQKRMNKQLFYDLLELFLCEVFPEIATKDFGDDSLFEDIN